MTTGSSEAEITEDTLLPLLRTAWLGRRMHALGVCDSTNVFARRLVEGEAPVAHGTLVVADYQRAGYGRHARGWVAPPGEALLFSLIFRRESRLSSIPGRVTMAAAVSACRALRSRRIRGISIKWPNDILSPDGRKLCGILTEAAGRQGAALICGIGINCNQLSFPPEISGSASSLRAILGRKVSRVEVLSDVLLEMEHWLGVRDEALCEAWQDDCGTLGRSIRVRFSDREVVGQAVGFEADGSLILRDGTGRLETVHSGDVEELRGLSD